jgi:predicted DNA-binding transcriptional regulator YafY
MAEIDRYYAYQSLFSGRKAVPKSEILKRLEISPATFKRDLTMFRDRLNTPILYDRDLGGYKLENPDALQQLPGLWFSQEEALALMTIQTMIGQLEPGLLGPKLKPLQTRLNKILETQGADANVLSERIRVVHAGKRRMPLKSFELVAKATVDRKQIEIVHLNRQTGESIKRIISPQQLIHYRDNWYVDAWCHLRGGIRSFAIDAIEGTLLLEKDAKDIDREQLLKQLQGGYGIFGGQAKAWTELKFTPERARWVQHEEWHPEQKGTLNKDGSYTLEVPYSDERELIGDILRMGSDVKVMGPATLAKQVKEALQRMLKQYN